MLHHYQVDHICVSVHMNLDNKYNMFLSNIRKHSPSEAAAHHKVVESSIILQ
jgi:hypothetical protein